MGNASSAGSPYARISAGTNLVRRLAALVLLVSMLITTSSGVALPPITAALDLLATLAARSPGERGAGVLSNKKARVPLETPGGSSSRRISEAPIPDAVPLPPDAGALPGAELDTGVLGGPAPVGGTDHFGSYDGFVPGSPGGGFPVGGGPAGFSPPGGGGGTPPGGGGGTTPPVTPVPEPGSWILMLASFALVGAQLRRRRLIRPATRCA